jgi:hypothetical protein
MVLRLSGAFFLVANDYPVTVSYSKIERQSEQSDLSSAASVSFTAFQRLFSW